MMATFLLTIVISMPLDSNTHLDITSTYKYEGPNAQQNCERERQAALKTKPQPGDKLTVGECRDANKRTFFHDWFEG